MRRFLVRGVIYLLPLLIIILAVYIVDPYYLFTNNQKFDEEKYKIGYSFDQGRRYKINTYMRNPQDKIILGASEINVISERNIPEQGWHSLSYGGAPLQESLRMLWEIDSIHKVKEVIIAPEFIKFFNAVSSSNGDPYYANFDWASSQSKKAFDIYNNPLDYFIDKYTLKSTWQYLIGKLNKGVLSGVPDSSKDSFWRSQLDYAKKTYDRDNVIKDKITEIYKLFYDIKKDSEENLRKVRIVIPVQHKDLLELEFQDGIYEYYKDYLRMLTDTFGEVFYFGYTENVSDNSDLFSDPFHYLSSDLYINGLFKNGDVTILTKDNLDEELDKIRQILLESEM